MPVTSSDYSSFHVFCKILPLTGLRSSWFYDTVVVSFFKTVLLVCFLGAVVCSRWIPFLLQPYVHIFLSFLLKYYPNLFFKAPSLPAASISYSEENRFSLLYKSSLDFLLCSHFYACIWKDRSLSIFYK